MEREREKERERQRGMGWQSGELKWIVKQEQEEGEEIQEGEEADSTQGHRVLRW